MAVLRSGKVTQNYPKRRSKRLKPIERINKKTNAIERTNKKQFLNNLTLTLYGMSSSLIPMFWVRVQ